MLLPSLARAKEQAKRTQCTNNNRQIGLGWTMYAEDNRDTYPVTTGWGDFGGQRGKPTATTQWLVPYFGINTDRTNRPINQYVSTMESWHCPSDKGDPNYSALSCFIEYGNSYCTQWAYDSWGVRHVSGSSPVVPTHPLKRPRWDAAQLPKSSRGDWSWENAGLTRTRIHPGTATKASAATSC